jgi:diguanylate cyclase (GGDEF)-like protein
MMTVLPSKWTLAGIVARTCAIIRQPSDLVMAIQMGMFLFRTSFGLTRGNPMGHFAHLRRRARLAQRFGRTQAERIVRVSYVYERYFKTRKSRYVRALLLHHFADSKALNGELFQALAKMSEKARRDGGAVMLFDVDGFGSIGDCLGNAAADRILLKIQRLIERETAGSGTAGRFGGDEILVVSNASAEVAMRKAQQICAAVSTAAFDGGNGRRVTVSGGVTFASLASNVVDMVECADQALHLAKDRGRNRVVALPAYRAVADPLLLLAGVRLAQEA